MNEDNKIISYFKKDANKVRLTYGEKEHVKNHIIFSPYLFHSTFFTYKRLVGVIALVALIISGGGTSFAAASSLPGDPLYGVKINVNEEVKSFIAISPDAKTKVEADKVKERLNEAEKLSAQGKLTTQNQAIIKENLKKHTINLKQNVAILASEKKTVEANQVIDDLKVSLDQHQAVLQDISSAAITLKAQATSTEEISASPDVIDDILNTVIETKAEVNNIQESIDGGDPNATTTPITIDGNTSVSSTLNLDIKTNASSTATTTIEAGSDIKASSTIKAKLLNTFNSR